MRPCPAAPCWRLAVAVLLLALTGELTLAMALALTLVLALLPALAMGLVLAPALAAVLARAFVNYGSPVSCLVLYTCPVPVLTDCVREVGQCREDGLCRRTFRRASPPFPLAMWI